MRGTSVQQKIRTVTNLLADGTTERMVQRAWSLPSRTHRGAGIPATPGYIGASIVAPFGSDIRCGKPESAESAIA